MVSKKRSIISRGHIKTKIDVILPADITQSRKKIKRNQGD